MPSNVRIFWWLSVGVAAYWIIMTAWFVVFPSIHYLAVIAQLPPEMREEAQRADILTRTISTAVWSSLTIGLAWLAAYRHMNWARWTFAAVFVIGQMLPFAIAAAHHQLGSYLSGLAFKSWKDAWGYVVPAVTIAAIIFVFSGNASGWFRSAKAET